MSLKTQPLQFLDIRSYLAPSYSYDALFKAYKCKLEKSFSPYDYFDLYDKLIMLNYHQKGTKNIFR
jgi:hypothetical protein